MMITRTLKNLKHRKVLASILAAVVAGSLLSSCGNSARCDELLNSLSYGFWSDSDSEWYYANCE